MKVLPEIGSRVHYRGVLDWGYGTRIEECNGVVVAHYAAYDDTDLHVLPQSEWNVAVEVDEPLPDWWNWPGTRRFAPAVAELSPAAPNTTQKPRANRLRQICAQ